MQSRAQCFKGSSSRKAKDVNLTCHWQLQHGVSREYCGKKPDDGILYRECGARRLGYVKERTQWGWRLVSKFRVCVCKRDRQTERWGREGEREKTNVKGVCNSYNDAARSSGGRLSVGKTAEREFEVGFSTFQFHYLKHHLISTSVSLTSKWSTWSFFVQWRVWKHRSRFTENAY